VEHASVCVCGRMMQVCLVTVLCTSGGGIEEADDTVQLIVAVDTGTTFELPEDGA